MSGADRPLTSRNKEDVLPRGSDFVFGPERKEAAYILSQHNGYERLSKGFLALTEISKALISQFDFSELLGPVIKKIVSVVEQTENDSRVFWGQSHIMFEVEAMKEMALESTMINHILVPLDGSALAECVLPHVSAMAQAFDASITLLHVATLPDGERGRQAIDPLDWHIRKHEAQAYLDRIASQLQNTGLQVDHVILDGAAAQSVIGFAYNTDVDLIALSTHGQSGLSEWNISGVVQKIMLRSFKSTLLVRAYQSCNIDFANIHYQRLFVGLDCSTRAEYSLPLAIRLAQFYNAQLILATVIPKPELVYRLLPSVDDLELAARIADRNYHVACHYLEGLYSQFSLLGIDLQSRLVVSDNPIASLHDLVEQVEPDLVLLVAHGHSGERRWPYGSIASSFITYGRTALLIMQDLSGDEILQTNAEMAALETKGH